ncbi:MAG: ECF transporter S component [Tenericutes bacterium]|nr:ECF transporter S component [Mycoplasmatota bacterium]
MSKKKVLTKKERINEMTILGLFIAIIAVMGLVPFLGFIPIFGLSATIVHIPVLIGAVLLGRKNGVILGLAFGVVSLIRGATSVGFDFVFIFPWVSILPRVIFGLIIYDVYRLFSKFIKVRIVALIVSFIVLSMIHSLLVLPMLVTTFPLILGSASWSSTVGSVEGVLEWMQDTSAFSTAMKWILGVLVTNSLVEALLAGVIGGTVADRLIQYLKLNNTTFRVEE